MSLGRSLRAVWDDRWGVDLVPFKTCTYDCIYCQLGRTTCKTIERKPWVPLDEVVDGLRSRLGSRPDYITLSGSGEPTLHAQIGELIASIKAVTDIPVAVLTNGALLWNAKLRQQLSGADLVLPSLDAGDENMFRIINRPDARIPFQLMLDGLVAFRQEFPGKYWLEIMVVGGYTATEDEIAKLAACVERITPSRVQLNTVTRPPAEESAEGFSPERLSDFALAFSPQAEVIADFRGIHKEPDVIAGRQEVLALLQRRPCSVADIAGGLGMHEKEVIKHLEELRARGAVKALTRGDRRYFHAVR